MNSIALPLASFVAPTTLVVARGVAPLVALVVVVLLIRPFTGAGST